MFVKSSRPPSGIRRGKLSGCAYLIGVPNLCTDTSTYEGSTVKRFNITALNEKCPLLPLSYQEVLLYCSIGTSGREVTEDTILDGWLLKKGPMIQMPSRVIY